MDYIKIMTLLKTITNFWPKRIWLQIFVILVALVVIPLMILGFLLIHTSQKAVQTSVLRDHKELVIRAASEVNEFVKKPQELLMAAAAILSRLQTDQWRQETTIVELALQNPVFQRISAVGLDGGEIATSELGRPLEDFSSDPAFIKARTGESTISDVRVMDNHIPLVTIGVAIRKFDKPVGVLTADVNLRGVWDIVDSIKIGKTGRAFAVCQAGRLLCHPNKRLVMGDQGVPYPEVIRQVLDGQTGSREIVGQDGKSWLVSYAPIKETHWGLVVYQSAEEAYAFSKIMQVQSWILMAISIMAALGISMILARFMSRPMNMLLKGTQHMAQGDFEYQLPVERSDEIGQLLASFNQLTGKLKAAQRMEKLSVIGKAATAIAHELKNSLVLLNTYVHVLPERAKDKKFISEFTHIVPEELKAWKEKLQNIIEYSKLNQFMIEDVDLKALIKDVGILAETRANQSDIGFVIKTNGNLPVIRGNTEKLKQVLLNLIGNALEATPWGGVITLSASMSENRSQHVLLEIHNTGSHIPQENFVKIFEPFYTTKSGGLGLGLSISKEIVDRLNGRIGVESSPADGTTFRVELPV